VGVSHGPPNALDAPNPTSSIKTISTFGAPAGGRTGRMGANFAFGSFASYKTEPAYGEFGIGRISRCIVSASDGSAIANLPD
jgi:hypothetical protein